MGYDGSGVEVRTRVLKGKSGFTELKDVFTVLNEIGCFVGTLDGQHIHIGAKDFTGSTQNNEDRFRLIESYVNNRDYILPFVAPHRHRSSMCSDFWTDAVKRNNYRTTYGMKGYDLNLANLKNGRKTVEIRLHEGNLDYEKAEAWVKFWIDFLDAIKSRKTVMPKYVRPDNLFRATGTHEETKKKLREAAKKYRERAAFA